MRSPCLRLLVLGASLTCLQANTLTAAIKEIVGAPLYFALGHYTNKASKKAGNWTTHDLLGIKQSPANKILALDFKFLFNEFGREFLASNPLPSALTFPPIKGPLILAPARMNAYEAGIKYLTIIELFSKVGEAWIEWEKMHGLLPQNSTVKSLPLKNGTVAGSLSQLPEDIKAWAVDYYVNTPVEYMENLPDQLHYRFSELAKDQQSATIALGYFLTALGTTVLTRMFGKTSCNALNQKCGFNLGENTPYKLTRSFISTFIGFATSYFIMPYNIYWLEELSDYLGYYDPNATKLNHASYVAAFKAPFAWEGVRQQAIAIASLVTAIALQISNGNQNVITHPASLVKAILAVTVAVAASSEYYFAPGIVSDNASKAWNKLIDVALPSWIGFLSFLIAQLEESDEQAEILFAHSNNTHDTQGDQREEQSHRDQNDPALKDEL